MYITHKHRSVMSRCTELHEHRSVMSRCTELHEYRSAISIINAKHNTQYLFTWLCMFQHTCINIYRHIYIWYINIHVASVGTIQVFYHATHKLAHSPFISIKKTLNMFMNQQTQLHQTLTYIQTAKIYLL